MPSDCGIEDGIQRKKRHCSSTHRRAGWGELFAGGVVAATLAELSSIKGKGRFRSRSVSGSSLRVAEMDKIRRTALEPRRRGGGLETPEYATRRGRVDLALCSLVLEAGLGVEQAAALEWQDLAVDANERPTIKIRRGSPGAGKIIEISKRAHDDLRTIAPKGAGTGKWIFGLNAIQIASRIRAAAQVAGIETRIESAAPRQGAHGVTAVCSTSTAQIGDIYWRDFRAWCGVRGAAHLPASTETVAAYLKETSQSRKLGPINSRLYAIGDAHLGAGYDDPCATPLVQATIRDIRQADADYSPKSLNPATLELIRKTATMPRRTAHGWESVAGALKRGLVDIALCSVMYAARLTVVQAVALKWRDVEIPGEDEAKLTVKSGTDVHGSADILKITGPAVRDLKAARRDARPDDRVFGLIAPRSVYRHIREVVKHAGLVAGGEPSTAGPCQTAPAVPWQTAPAVPCQTASADPCQTTPTNPGQWAPAEPWQWVPAVSGQSAPAVPWQTAPEIPWQTDPAVPGQSAPAVPWQSVPMDLWQSAPAVPWQSARRTHGKRLPRTHGNRLQRTHGNRLQRSLGKRPGGPLAIDPGGPLANGAGGPMANGLGGPMANRLSGLGANGPGGPMANIHGGLATCLTVTGRQWRESAARTSCRAGAVAPAGGNSRGESNRSCRSEGWAY